MRASLISGIASWFAGGWTVVVGLFLLFGPAYSTAASTVTASPAGASGSAMQYEGVGLLGEEGGSALVLVAIPILLTIGPLAAKPARLRSVLSITAAVVLGGFVVVGGFSVGLLYAPAALALLVAGATARAAQAAS